MVAILGDIEFKLNETKLHQNTAIEGAITVTYPGKYDGVVVNTTIADSNEHITYTSYNGQDISQNNSRLYISRDAMPHDTACFAAVITFKPEAQHEVRFRASVIEQHKEIDSKTIFATYS